jgi:hypothetical protein
MNPFYPLGALRAYHRCEYCHARESVFNFPFGIGGYVCIVNFDQQRVNLSFHQR